MVKSERIGLRNNQSGNSRTTAPKGFSNYPITALQNYSIAFSPSQSNRDRPGTHIRVTEIRLVQAKLGVHLGVVPAIQVVG